MFKKDDVKIKPLYQIYKFKDFEIQIINLIYEINEIAGCQIILTKELEGATFTLPSATRNFYVDGHVPKPH